MSSKPTYDTPITDRAFFDGPCPGCTAEVSLYAYQVAGCWLIFCELCDWEVKVADLSEVILNNEYKTDESDPGWNKK